MTEEKTRTCNKCKTSYSISYFHRDGTRPEGISYICKSCANVKSNRYYWKNRERINMDRAQKRAAGRALKRQAKRVETIEFLKSTALKIMTWDCENIYMLEGWFNDMLWVCKEEGMSPKFEKYGVEWQKIPSVKPDPFVVIQLRTNNYEPIAFDRKGRALVDNGEGEPMEVITAPL